MIISQKPYIIMFWLILLASALFSQILIKHDNPDLELQDKWEWAKKSITDKEYWIGYSFGRLMSEDSYIGCFESDYNGFPTLDEILNHNGNRILQKSPKTRENRKHRHFVTCDQNSVEKVMKQIGVLFRVVKKGKNFKIEESIVTNICLAVDLDKLSLVWLGNSDHDQSLDHLEKIYKKSEQPEAKKDMIVAISLHPPSARINEFLKKIIFSNASNELRKSAVFWLGNQKLKETPGLLFDIVENDRSLEVRKEAVFAISLVDGEESTDKLIDIARKNPEIELRKTAIFWLGQKASKSAVDFLDETVYSNEETEIQKQAVFALSQLDNDDALDKLIKVAKTHPNSKIRKNAIFWLGQSEDDRALDTIVEFIKQNR